jgi:hypothetical protein
MSAAETSTHPGRHTARMLLYTARAVSSGLNGKLQVSCTIGRFAQRVINVHSFVSEECKYQFVGPTPPPFTPQRELSADATPMHALCQKFVSLCRMRARRQLGFPVRKEGDRGNNGVLRLCEQLAHSCQSHPIQASLSAAEAVIAS